MREKYQRLFRVQSGAVPFFSADIWGRYYEKFKAVQTYTNGVWTSYIPKGVMKKTLKEGLELYSNTEKFKSYQNEFEQYKKNSRKLFEEILATKTITITMAQEFFRMATKLFAFYSKVDFFYTDLAFAKSQEDELSDLAKNLKHIEQIKNPGREFLNDVFFGENSYLFKVIKKIAIQYNFAFDDLLGCSVQEIMNLINGGKLDVKKAAERLNSFVMIGKGDSTEYISGNKAIKFIRDFEQAVENQKKMLSGAVANPGNITGKVRIIPSTYYYDFSALPKIIEKMKEGEILVAETTSPELMPACKKAAAIITDQGGLLSHAAIVSREMGIPCIVGTGIATQVLKNGDEVEIDGDAGTITIL